MHALAVPAKKPARRSPRQPETASIRRVLARSHGRVGRCRVSRRAGADRLAQRRRRRVPGRVHAPAGTRHRVRKRRAPESLAAARHGEPLPRLGAFDLEPPHGRLHEHADIPAPDAFDADIWEVVGALPPDLRIPVHLFYVEGYATEEIARITGCRPSTVRTRLHRAREQLRNMLEDDRGQRESSLASCRDPLCRKEPNRDRSPQPRPTPNRG